MTRLQLREKFVNTIGLKTAFFTGEVELYKNVSASEFYKMDKDAPDLIRAFIFKNGETYFGVDIAGYEDNYILHEDILKAMVKAKLLSNFSKSWFSNNRNYLITIEKRCLPIMQRSNHSKEFLLSEAIDKSLLLSIPHTILFDYKRKFEKNNPGLILNIED